MDDRRAALLLALLALTGAGARYALSPVPTAAPGDVRLVAVDTPPPGGGLREAARVAARLARPLLSGERIDVDRADVTEITRLPRVGPALAQRIVAWREQHGSFGTLARLDSVPGVGPHLLEALRPYVMFAGGVRPALRGRSQDPAAHPSGRGHQAHGAPAQARGPHPDGGDRRPQQRHGDRGHQVHHALRRLPRDRRGIHAAQRDRPLLPAVGRPAPV